MNEFIELQKVQIENELRRHYIYELLGDRYDVLVCFMLAVSEGLTNGLLQDFAIGEIRK